jgi:ligand-binding sensor domain-containing protein
MSKLFLNYYWHNNRFPKLELWVVFVFIVSLFSKSTAQPKFYFEHFSLEKGLSQGSGYAVAQYDDYMWFGTQDGLNRFDGYDFTVFRADEAHSVNDNFIQNLLTDSQGRFWVATSKGLCLYQKGNEKFASFNAFFGLKHLVDKASISQVTEDKYGHIWIETDEKGLFSFDPKTKQIKEYKGAFKNIINFAKSKDGTLHFVSDKEVFKGS